MAGFHTSKLKQIQVVDASFDVFTAYYGHIGEWTAAQRLAVPKHVTQPHRVREAAVLKLQRDTFETK
ncbi:hypothetical protein ElyMa_001848000 [Elysia marginata]|uniref:Uncharacterized protein n=1 Tax=Elysia marginata TaxID=1093978 RepID=A0AAV4EK66_9GAST|nr:hypothetical protein ElyMa_001848000 [Elysia marginata]